MSTAILFFACQIKKCCPFLNSENLCDMHIAIGGGAYAFYLPHLSSVYQ